MRRQKRIRLENQPVSMSTHRKKADFRSAFESVKTKDFSTERVWCAPYAAKAAHIVEMMIAFRHILWYSKECEMGAAVGCRRFLKPTMNTHMEVNTNGKIAAAV